MSISMVNFKAGDKVVKANGERWSHDDEYGEIVWVSDNGTHCQLRSLTNFYPTSGLKLYKTDHKNYLEVLTDIKIGEVWSSLSGNNIITKTKEGVVEVTDSTVSVATNLDLNIKYTLTKTTVTFQEAFLLYEGGGVIESEVDHEIFYNSKEGEGCCFSPKQIRGMWFINN